MAIVRTQCVNLGEMIDTMLGTQGVILDTFAAVVSFALTVIVLLLLFFCYTIAIIASFLAIAAAAVPIIVAAAVVGTCVACKRHRLGNQV